MKRMQRKEQKKEEGKIGIFLGKFVYAYPRTGVATLGPRRCNAQPQVAWSQEGNLRQIQGKLKPKASHRYWE